MRISSLCVMIIALFSFVFSETDSGILDLKSRLTASSEPIPLAGEWLVVPHRLLTPDDSIKDGESMVQQVPSSWTKYSFRGKPLPPAGVATYVVSIIIPTTYRDSLLAFHFPRIGSSYRCFVDGKIIAEAGNVTESPQTMVPGYRYQTVPFTPQSDTIKMIIQVANFQQIDPGIWHAITFGTASALERSETKGQSIHLVMIGLLFMIMLYHLCVAFFMRSERSALYLGLFAGSLILYLGTLHHIPFWILGTEPDFHLSLRLSYLNGLFPSLLIYFTMRSLFPDEYPRLFHRVVVALLLIHIAVTAVSPSMFYTTLLPFTALMTLALLLAIALRQISALKHKREGARAMVIAFGVMVVFWINDILYSALLIKTAYIGEWGIIALMTFYAVFLAFRFSRSFAKVKLLATDLQDRESSLQQTLTQLQEHRSFTIQAVNNSHQLFGWITPDGILQFANQTALSMIACRSEDVVGKLFWETPWFSHNETEQLHLQEAIGTIRSTELPIRYDTIHRDKENREHQIDFHLRPTFDQSHRMVAIVAEGVDVTEERQAALKEKTLKEQLHQSQKMEAVGQLAGGVAHDFNNALGGILGAAELLKTEGVSAEEQTEYLDLILTAGDRAADLTKKLLLFSRKGAKVSSAVNCTKIVEDTVSLLKHTINKNITVKMENRAIQTSVIGDNSLLQNALMNMGINASHAMPDGGELTFTLENLELDAEYCEVSPFDMKPGEYLELSIRDTGCGMSPEIQTRIFEPFFTTKEAGKGTGLGMAAVYGTVQEHNGAITVYSEVGTGTVFRIYLPVTSETVKREIESETIPVGSGTILVIDDEELIRVTASALLRSMGYRVILATNGLEGVNTFAETKEDIDLIILDMIMPVMGGREADSPKKRTWPL